MMIILFIALFSLYSLLRKKFPGTKYLPETVTILIVFLISFEAKCFVYYFVLHPYTDGGNWLTEIGFFFSVIYGTVANFGWGGQETATFAAASSAIGATAANVLVYLYYGTAVLQAAVFLVVITSTANYEFYSMLRLSLGRTLNRRKSVYVFTALNEDTLSFAKSIEKRFEQEELERKKHKQALKTSGKIKSEKCLEKDKRPKGCCIVFAGPEIGAFDRKSDLHRGVVAENYYYWSYSAEYAKNARKPIAKIIKCFNNNVAKPEREFAVYAFALDENLRPKEKVNSDVVFSDMRRRLNLYPQTSKNAFCASRYNDCMHVDYYVLTKQDVNYHAYSASYDKIWRAEDVSFGEKQRIIGGEDKYFVLKKNKPEGYSKENAAINARRKRQQKTSQLYVINEANLIAANVADKLNQCADEIYNKISTVVEPDVAGMSAEEKSAALQEYARIKEEAKKQARAAYGECMCGTNKNGVEQYELWLLGFGGVGQSVFQEMYAQTAEYSDKTVTEPSGVKYRKQYGFVAKAFDPNVDEYDGLFTLKHPMAACAVMPDGAVSSDDEIKIRNVEEQKVRKNIGEAVVKMLETSGENLTAKINQILEDKYNGNNAVIYKSNPHFEREKEFLETLSSQLEHYFKACADFKESKDVASAVSLSSRLIENTDATIKTVTAEEQKMSDKEKGDMRINRTALLKEFRDCVVFNDCLTEGNEKISGYCGEMSVPVVEFFKQSCNAALFADILKIRDYPNMMMIAMGTDFMNIELANACFRDLVTRDRSRAHWLTVVVNIRDGRNNILLDCKSGINFKQKIIVIITGGARELYTYKSICDFEDAKKYNYIYNRLYDLNESGYDFSVAKDLVADNAETFTSKAENVKQGEKVFGFISDFVGKNALMTDSADVCEDQWNGINQFTKDSNRSAAAFRGRLRREAEMLSCEDGKFCLTKSDYHKLIALEHARWTRFHVASGWTCGSRDKDSLIHDSIAPLLLVPRSKLLYDLINVTLAVGADKIAKPSPKSSDNV